MLVLLALVILRWAPWQKRNTQAMTLAVVGPLSGPDKANGEVMLNSVRWRVQQANREAEGSGFTFRVLPLDDQNDPAQAKREQRFPGYYTDGIYAVSHFLYDYRDAGERLLEGRS